MKAVSLSDSLQHLPTIFLFTMKNRTLREIMPINKWSWIISWSVEEADGVRMLRSGALNENIIQNHVNMAFLKVF